MGILAGHPFPSLRKKSKTSPKKLDLVRDESMNIWDIFGIYLGYIWDIFGGY
jgi:hypothetical protein